MLFNGYRSNKLFLLQRCAFKDMENIRPLSGDCNTCMTYNIDTYKVIDNGLILVNSRGLIGVATVVLE